MFGLAQSQKMDGKSFCRNFLDLVWFSAYVVRREVGVSLGTFYKIPQVHQVLFRYIPEVTGQKLRFTMSRRHDEPEEPIKSTQTLQIVLQISCQILKK